MPWRYFFGLFLLAIGLGYLIEYMNYIPGGFHFIEILMPWWPLIVIGAGINQFIRHKEQPWGSLIVFAMGVFLLAEAQNRIPWSGSWKFLLAIVVMSLAMRMMLPRQVQQYQSSAKGTPAGAKVRIAHSIRDRQVFGNTHFRNDSQQFVGGKLGAFLGDYELDLRGATLSATGADLRIKAIFGTVHVRVPQQMVLEVSGVPVLAAAENSAQQIVSKADGLPAFKIRYFALFGAVVVSN